MMTSTDTILVIGAGVIGLSTALRIQHHLRETRTLRSKSQPSILVVAEDFPGSTSINYTSSWAGAHYRPVPGSTPELQTEAVWARYAYSLFEKIVEDEPAAGVQFMDGIEHFESKPSKEYLEDIQECLDKKKTPQLPSNHQGEQKHINAYEHLIPSLRQLSSEELPSRVQYGISYRSFCVNPPVYCNHLLRKFILQGGQTRKYRLADLQEVFHLEDTVKVVVNCSGRGFCDPKSYIVRGQTVLVRNPCPYTLTRDLSNGTRSFCVPRPLNGGTIVGGTRDPHDWDPVAHPETRQTLLKNATKWFPFDHSNSTPSSGSNIADNSPAEESFSVIQDVVGRRPFREGGVRVEVERVEPRGGKWAKQEDHDRENIPVVHAYGLGSRGFELSWGVAEDAALLVVQEYLNGAKETARL